MVNHDLMASKISKHLTLKSNRTYVNTCKKVAVFLRCLTAGAVLRMHHSNHFLYKTNDGSDYDFEGSFKIYSVVISFI